MNSDFNTFSIGYIKRQYCNYKCPVKKLFVSPKCGCCDLDGICSKLDVGCNKSNMSAYEVCQFDNIINELRNFGVIK